MDRFEDSILAWVASHPSAEGKGPLDADSDLIGRGVFDSLALLDLVSFLETRFELTLPVEEFVPENFQNVKAVAGLARRLAGRTP